MPQRVFISYSHDSANHKLSVLELANQLRRDGVNARIDRYSSPPELGWTRWMNAEIAAADFVVVVCTAIYKGLFDGVSLSQKEAGARWDGLILDASLHGELAAKGTRFISVVFEDGSSTSIPVALLPAPHFRLPDQYEEFSRLLTGAPPAVAPPTEPEPRSHAVSSGRTVSPLPVVFEGANEHPVAGHIAGGGDRSRGTRSTVAGWSAANDRAIGILQDRWRARQLTLMVGAGTSAAVGIPLWPDLIAHLVGAYVEKTYAPTLGSGAVDAIRATLQDELRSLSPIQTAEFIQSRLSNPELTEILRDCLYRNARPPNSSSPLLRAIVALHAGLHGIVSFNFDDALERALDQGGLLYTSIVSGRDLAGMKGLPIYHPHGFLPRSGKGSESIVFAESQYHSQYMASHTWTNVVVQRLLLESTCLFVGTSLSDPNLRRMIDLAHRENDAAQHFYIAVSPRASDQYQPAVLEILQAAHESMGITPVWLEHYDQVSAFLGEINQTA